MKKIGIISHCSTLSATVARKIAGMDCAGGKPLVFKDDSAPQFIAPVSLKEIEPFVFDTAIIEKPSPVYDFKRMKKAKRK